MACTANRHEITRNGGSRGSSAERPYFQGTQPIKQPQRAFASHYSMSGASERDHALWSPWKVESMLAFTRMSGWEQLS